VFRERVREWLERGWVSVWYEGRSATRPDRDVEPRHVAPGGMRTLMTGLASDLDVRQSTRASSIEVRNGSVRVSTPRGVLSGDAAVLTAPVPQSISLLEAGGVGLSDVVRGPLDAIRYEPSLTVMATLAGPSGLPRGHVALDGSAAWIADNRDKGVSAEPTVTIQSSAEYASRHLETDPRLWVADLVDLARPHLASPVTDVIPHRWRFAQPRDTLDVGAMGIGAGATLVLAGEAFAGAKVEGAFLSGLAAAELVSASG
jgi:predicted NAD/FAD-dependent oxidoreductase